MAELASLTPDKRNANKGTVRGRALLEDSLRRYGAGRSILADKHGNIIAGNKTLEASADIGLPVRFVQTDGHELVVVQRTDLDLDTDKAARELAYADNRVAQLDLDWDVDALLADQAAGVDLAAVGFDPDELAALLSTLDSGTEGLTDPDSVPAPPAAPVTQPGDLWLLGRHRLGCIDATDIAAVEQLIGGSRPDLVLTDPPYGVSVVQDAMVGADFGVATKGKYAPIIGDETNQTAIDAYNLCAALGIPRLIFWGGNYYADALPSSGCWLVWDKRGDSGIENTFADCELAWTNLTGQARIYRQLWNGMIRQGEHDPRIHPTQKPVGLLQWCIERYSDRAAVVLDLFVGSGSTLIACEQSGRVCIGAELSPAYVDAAVSRWEAFTGKTAVRQASTSESMAEPRNR